MRKYLSFAEFVELKSKSFSMDFGAGGCMVPFYYGADDGMVLIDLVCLFGLNFGNREFLSIGCSSGEEFEEIVQYLKDGINALHRRTLWQIDQLTMEGE